MTNYSTAGAPDILTTLYPNGVEELFMVDFPAYGLFTKKTDYLAEGGRELNWQVGSGGGDAVTVTQAEATEGASLHKRPKITRVKEYATATVEREDILATRNDPKRIMEVWDLAIRNSMRKIKRSIGMHMFRDGTGFRAKVSASATIASTTLLLETANDAKLFEAGDTIMAINPTGPAARTGGAAQILLTGRDIGGGKLYAGSNFSSAITDIAVGDYLARAGDFLSGAGQVCKGIGGWVPVTAPTVGGGDSWFGVDRAPLGEAAYGHRPSLSSTSMFSIGIDAASYLFDVTGSGPDIWLVNAMDMAMICKDATGLEEIVVQASSSGKKEINIGYDAASVHGPQGKITVIADPFCPRGKSWMGNREEAQWWTLGAMIDRITMGMGEDNGFVKAGVDGVGIRFGGFFNFVITRPWHWAYVALPTG
jgi:hypothetical protein